jgi:hypothetical protein
MTHRPHRQRWQLRARQLPLGHASTAEREPAPAQEVRVTQYYSYPTCTIGSDDYDVLVTVAVANTAHGCLASRRSPPRMAAADTDTRRRG